MPCLELDDGSILAEITAICEYLDEISPGASLIGATPQERAESACGPVASTSASSSRWPTAFASARA